MANLHFLLHETFRSNPAFELIELDILSQPRQQALAGLLTNPDIFGIFQPKNTVTTSTKLAYKEVALLFYALQKPGKLPHYFKLIFDDETNTTLAKLILEGVFEIEVNNQFVSGTAAQSIVYQSITHSNTNQPISLSTKAIQYALRLKAADTRLLTSKLYCYNTIPLFPTPENAFNKLEVVEDFLNIGNNTFLKKKIENDWNYHQPNEKFSWLSWNRKITTNNHSSNNSTYKIYISPTLDSLPEVFEKSVVAITKSKAFSFKVGMDRIGLLRPDKFVVYFYTYEDLMEAATYLIAALINFETAQGVPFTAALDDIGMLSWGIDPPSDDIIENIEGGSWRASIAEKIALAVAQANAEKLNQDKGFEFVMNKIALEGIDPQSWIPVTKEIKRLVPIQNFEPINLH